MNHNKNIPGPYRQSSVEQYVVGKDDPTLQINKEGLKC